MGMLGYSGVGFAPDPTDPYATSQGPGFAVPQKPAPPRRPGFLAALGQQFGQAFSPERRGRTLMILGQTLHDIGSNSNTLPNLLAQLQEEDRQRLAEMWQQQLQQRQQGEWNDADKQSAREAQWAQGQGETAQVNPHAAYQAYEAAQAPPTAYQRQSLAQDQSQFEQAQQTIRRGQDFGLMEAQARLQAGGGLTRLRGSDASQLTRIQQAGENARQLSQLAEQFQRANRNTGSGPVGQFTQYFGGDMAAMRSASSLMRGLMRPVGSGSTSDYEQRLYAQGAPDPGLPGAANDERIRNIMQLADIANARQFFYENYADANGTLRGAEQAFQASQEFRQITQRQAQATTANAQPGARVRYDAQGNRIIP